MTSAPFLLLALALMCENVNAAPQASLGISEDQLAVPTSAGAAPFTLASDMPPFRIGDPMCNTGFTIAQRYDTRNAAGTIIKSVWIRKCTKGRIVYGRKV
jgi:hypothetical protein